MTLGVAIANVVVFQIDLNLAQIGVEKILACSNRPDASRAVRRLRPLVVSAHTPERFPPLVELSNLPHKDGLAALLEGWQTRARLSLESSHSPLLQPEGHCHLDHEAEIWCRGWDARPPGW